MHKIRKFQFGGQNGSNYFTPSTPQLPFNAQNYLTEQLMASLQPSGLGSFNAPSTSQTYEAVRTPMKSLPLAAPTAPTPEMTLTTQQVNPIKTKGGLFSGMSGANNGKWLNKTFGKELPGGGTVAGAVQSIADPIAEAIGGPKEHEDKAIKGVGDIGRGVMSQVNPVAGMVNSVSNVANEGLAKLMGKSTDFYNRSDQIFNQATDALNMLGPIGMAANFVLDFANIGTGTTVKGVNLSDEAKAMRGGYEGTVSSAEKMRDRTFGGISRIGGSDRRYRRKVRAMQKKVDKIEDIGEEAQDAFAASNNPLLYNKRQMQLNGGYQSMAVGKEGMKLFTSEQRALIKKILEMPTSEVPTFKEGGQINVIPEGALHAHKHHMDIEGITNKGIPVVTLEKGNVVQQAEIERNEIIFSLEVTKKLEKLKEDGSDDAAIEAGKLLVDEILRNTVDNTGLLKEVD